MESKHDIQGHIKKRQTILPSQSANFSPKNLRGILQSSNWATNWGCPKMGVYPKSCNFTGFSPIKTIYLGRKTPQWKILHIVTYDILWLKVTLPLSIGATQILQACPQWPWTLAEAPPLPTRSQGWSLGAVGQKWWLSPTEWTSQIHGIYWYLLSKSSNLPTAAVHSNN